MISNLPAVRYRLWAVTGRAWIAGGLHLFASRLSISLWVTLARLFLAVGVVATIVISPAWTAVPLGVVVLADVFDGVLARKRGEDSDTRRAVDAAVDRFSVHAAFAAALLAHHDWLSLYVPLLIRDVAALAVSGALIRNRGLLLVGGRAHKLSSLSAAAFGLALVNGSHVTAGALGAACLTCNLVLLGDYAGGLLMAFQREAVGRFRITGFGGLRYLLVMGRRADPSVRQSEACLVPLSL